MNVSSLPTGVFIMVGIGLFCLAQATSFLTTLWCVPNIPARQRLYLQLGMFLFVVMGAMLTVCPLLARLL